MNENKLKVWLARDENGELFVYKNAPIKGYDCWQWSSDYFKSNTGFPSVRWEDNKPTEAYITLANELQAQSQQKKEIDWEQRRYDLAKTLFFSQLPIYTDEEEKQNSIKSIIELVDLFINELKKQANETDD